MKKRIEILILLLIVSGSILAQTKTLESIKRDKLIQVKNLNELGFDLPSDIKIIKGEMSGKIGGKVVIVSFSKLELNENVFGLFKSMDLNSTLI